MFRRSIFVLLLLIIPAVLFFSQVNGVNASPQPQIPTVAIPTVTGTPEGSYIIVGTQESQINVRSGPSRDYELIGVLIAGQKAPALGRSPGGEWIQISYPGVQGGVGWVYSPLVAVFGELLIVEPPPTPTPHTTPTIDPTLAAQFIVEVPSTKLPTYTPPPPLVIPTFTDASLQTTTGNFPVGYVIIGLAVLGAFGMLISFLRGR